MGTPAPGPGSAKRGQAGGRSGRAARLLAVLLAVTTLSAGPGRCAEPAPAELGALGDPGRLVFEGAKTFTAEELRGALQDDLDFLLASHPRAPRAAYPAALRGLLVAGYRYSGFPEARVEVRLDEAAGKVRVVIDEGPRFRCGKVKVLGAVKLPAEGLVKLLAEPQPRAQGVTVTLTGTDAGADAGEQLALRGPESWSAVWEAGRPVSFTEHSQQDLTKSVTNALADLGYFSARFTARPEPDRERGLADLVVRIEDEGPAGVIGEISVTGLKTHTPEEVAAHLGVRRGSACTRRDCQRFGEELILSGRFVAAAARIEPAGGEGRELKLVIEAVECPGVPKLAEKLGETDLALLRVREWLAEAPLRGEDISLVVTESDYRLRITVGHRGGLVVRCCPGTGPDWNRGLDLLADEGRGRFCGMSGRNRLTVPWPRSTLEVQLGIDYRPDRDAKAPHALLFAFHTPFTPGEAKAPPVRFQLHLPPAAFLGYARRAGYRVAVAGGRLAVAGDGFSMEADAATGRLIAWRVTGEAAPGEAAKSAEVAVAKGLFEGGRKAFEERSARAADAGEGAGAIGAMILLAAREALAGPAAAADPHEAEAALKQVETLVRVLDKALVEPLAELVPAGPEAQKLPGDRFAIQHRLPGDPASEQGLTGMMVEACGLAVAAAGSRAFAHDSWPAAVCRESALLATGRGKYTGAELQRLHDAPETGPLFFLTAAQLLGMIGKPDAAGMLAARGLERLAAADFRRDIRALAAPELPTGKFLLNLAAALGKLNDEEVATLAGALEPAAAEPLRAAARAARAVRDGPADKKLDAALDAAWDRGLRKQVEEALRKLAPPKRGMLDPGED